MATAAAKPQRRSPHRTQWAAQFAVASELCKRGHQVALTLGNHPMTDVMVVSPSGKAYSVDVKGLYQKTYWLVRERPPKADHFYVFAFVPNEGNNRFFIASQETVNRELQAYLASERKSKGSDFDESKFFSCLEWKYVEQFEDSWKTLPD